MSSNMHFCKDLRNIANVLKCAFLQCFVQDSKCVQTCVPTEICFFARISLG